MPLHPILPPEATATKLHSKACKRSLGVSQRAGANFQQLFNLWAVPKEMPLLPAKVADLWPGLFIRLLHLF